ncbi:MAG TPA: hypothetical protein VHE12_05430 [bacterium]|nr:hypothetical protein [bacterium]
MAPYRGETMHVTDFLTNFEHLAKEKVQEMKLAAEKKLRECLREEVFRSVRYEDLLKSGVRCQWIQYLGGIKEDRLTEQEFNIGMTVFEILYK